MTDYQHLNGKWVVVVLGMHRSGTSAITRGLQVLGADLGSELMPGVEGDNEKGFWEDLGCYQINERVLEKLGSAWDAMAEVPEEALTGSELVEEHRDAMALISSRLRDTETFAFKDPRTANLLPFWQKVFAALNLDDRYLIALRNPRSVADSLARRNGFAREKSFCLWMKHVCSALRYGTTRPFVVVDYDQFMESPASELNRIATPLGFERPDDRSNEFRGYISEFLTQGLRHSHYSKGDSVDDVVPSFVSGLYDLILTERDITSDNFEPRSLWEKAMSRYKNYESSIPVMQYLDRLDQDNQSLEQDKEKLEQDNQSLEQDKEKLEQENHSLGQDKEKLEQDNYSLEQDKDWAEQDNYRLEQDRVDRSKEFDLLTIDFQRLQHELEETSRALEATQNEFKEEAVYSRELSAQMSEQRKQTEELDSQLKRIYSQLYAFNGSVLGRLYKLIAWVYSLLSFRPRSTSFYGQLVAESTRAVQRHPEGTLNTPDSPGRIRMVARILRYVARHPYSSLRLVSVYRVKKLIRTVFLADSSTAREWVSARFPKVHSANRTPDIVVPESLPKETTLTFPKSDHPEVSIVIPVYNQYQTTLSCLKAVLEHTGEIEYEVIVADDCSTDITSSIETFIHNIQVVRGDENLGFLGNCNNAVTYARGRYVVLLNNDTNVQEGWLGALVNTMKAILNAGMVGPKLLFENGVLQEAGGIVWNDASGWNYGRGQSPDQPEFNYVRETDYISGACILFEKQIWDELGGFDERFKPAYYEDTDLAFQMRARGLKVLYQPESEVVHFEGVSNGTDVGSGIKKHQAINQQVFRDKWQEVLEKEHFPNGENVFQAREHSAAKRTVVFVDHYVPFYDKDAGSRSTYLYVKSMLDAGLNVKFVPSNFFPHQPYTRTLQQLGVEVLLGEKSARNWKTWFSDNAQYIDVIYLHRPHVTEDFIDHLAALQPKPKLIYFGHDLHYLRTGREAELMGNKAIISDAKDWKQRELAIFKKVDKVYYPSEVEVAEVRRVSPGTDVSAIPLYLLKKPDISQYQHVERDGLLFVGGFNHPPNADAVTWFVKEVLPSLQRQVPDICLHIVGSSVPDNIKDLSSSCVKIHGFLSDEDLAALYQKVKLCVVPLRYGAGVKGKILEALQAGLPISTTSIGAEGLPEAAGVMAIADQPSDMVSQIFRLYNDPDECGKYLANYRDYIEQHFSQSQVQQVIDRDFLN